MPDTVSEPQRTGDYQAVDLSSLAVGRTLSSAIFGEEHNVELLGSGESITAELIERLRTSGVRSVMVHKTDLSRLQALRPQGTETKSSASHTYVRTDLQSPATRHLESQLNGQPLVLPAQADPVQTSFKKRNGGYDAEQATIAIEQHERHVTFLDKLFTEIEHNPLAELTPLASIWDSVLTQAIEDFDLFVCLGITPRSVDYPFRHSLHTAKTAAAIGAMMGLGADALHCLTRGCLVHDLGMLKLETPVFSKNRRLVVSELRQLSDHPILTLQLLEAQLDEFSEAAQSVIFQIHERCNGSGYPRGIVGDGIHPLARIAAVADTFVALVSDRPHRKGLQPYYAMETLLQNVRLGYFDSEAVRALLCAVSLFPLGSYVKLSNGRVGRVIRSNRERFDRPVIETWDEARSYVPAEVVDLVNEPHIKITRPIATPKAATP